MKKTTKSIITVAATLALVQSSNAATISILNLSANAGGSIVSGFTVSSASSGTPEIQTYSLTRTGDLDGLGSDDTLAFNLISKRYTGSTISAGDVTLGTQAAAHDANVNWGSSIVADLSTLTFEITGVTYSSAESTVAFSGFNEIQKVGGNPSNTESVDFYFGTTGATTANITAGNQNFDLSSNPDQASMFLALTTEYDASETGNIRLRNLDFSFETSPIPEPSSTALLGLGFGALVLRRRRS